MTGGPPQDTRPCTTCGRSGAVVRGAGRDATVGTVAATLEAGWVVVCDAGHRTSPAIGTEVADEVLARLPTATRRRLGRSDRCVGCDAPLTMPVRRTDRPVPVADVPGVPVTTIHLDVPSTRCLACSTDQVPTRSVADVRAAVLALFAAGTGSA